MRGSLTVFPHRGLPCLAEALSEGRSPHQFTPMSGAHGFGANGASRSSVMTPDGRYVAFVSAANNLVPRDTNGIPDVFVRDLQANTTTLVSVGARAAWPTSASEDPDITPSGQYVAFYSTATNLVPGVAAGADVYVRDLVSSTSTWASSGAKGIVHSNTVLCFNHRLSADGQFVAYEASGNGSTTPVSLVPASYGFVLRYNVGSGVTDLVGTNAAVPTAANEDIRSLDMTPDGQFIAYVANTNGIKGDTTCVRLWSAATGISTLVSGDVNGQVPSNSTCDWPTLDATGRFVAFMCSPRNLTANAVSGDYHLSLRDTQAGTTTLLDADTNGVGSPISASTIPIFSADMGLVAFESADAALVAGDRNHDYDVFVRDMSTGASELISAHEASLPSVSPNGTSIVSADSLSADNRYVTFASEADNLVGDDTNGLRDVFVRDVVSATLELVSVATNGVCSDGVSTDASITADGMYVVFTSSADNLVAGDTNRAQDVFVRDLQAGTTALVSASVSGGPGNAASYSSTIDRNGRYVVFLSKANNLALGTYPGKENIFLRDLQAGTTTALTMISGTVASMTPDGRFVAFLGVLSGSYSNLYVWDTQAAARTYTNNTSGISSCAISPDGSRVAFWAGVMAPSLYIAEPQTGTSSVLLAPIVSAPPGLLRFSADSSVLTFAAKLSNTNQVYFYDFRLRTNVLVSHTFFSGTAAAYGSSDYPAVSADGRFISYRSAATNLVAGVTNGVPQVFLYDRQTGMNTLLSGSVLGTPMPNNRSMAPFFSADGRVLLFQSWASDLVANDFNHAGDIFSYTLMLGLILPGSGPGEGPWVSWPWVPGKAYGVEFKDDLNEPSWHPLTGTITHSGTKGFIQDPAPAAGQRFYRILAH